MYLYKFNLISGKSYILKSLESDYESYFLKIFCNIEEENNLLIDTKEKMVICLDKIESIEFLGKEEDYHNKKIEEKALNRLMDEINAKRIDD